MFERTAMLPDGVLSKIPVALGLSPTSCVTWGESLGLSEPPLVLYSMSENKSLLEPLDDSRCSQGDPPRSAQTTMAPLP